MNNDLWVVPMLGDRTPAVFLRTPFSEMYAKFSPDGRWVAHDSNASGRMQDLRSALYPAWFKGSCRCAMAGVDLGRHDAHLAA